MSQSNGFCGRFSRSKLKTECSSTLAALIIQDSTIHHTDFKYLSLLILLVKAFAGSNRVNAAKTLAATLSGSQQRKSTQSQSSTLHSGFSVMVLISSTRFE